ncbi:hypothetical protein [Kutzneria sp. 744]|uniref:hypothetical protein n=1 Tax=Kutzneria sp. (strain 744) TaxID=345341 RepID=UPI0004B14C36|nr:hypothetical protein [Kutzneria sp. 744]
MTAEDKVRQALHATRGATAAEIAVAAGVGGSTARKILARLAEEGGAVRQPGGTPRTADRWHAADTAAETTTDQEPDQTALQGNVVDCREESAADDQPLDTHSPAADAEPATTSESSVDASAAATTVAGHGGSASTTTVPRLRPGDLRGKVEDHLTAHAGMEFTPGEIARALGGRSAGAVANALATLASTGVARLSCERPKRYTRAGDDAATQPVG